MTNERIREAVEQAATDMDRVRQERPPTNNPVAIGDQFVLALPNRGNVPLCEMWFVVNFHPDSNDTALVVPLDDAPFVGVCDVVINDPLTPSQAPFMARCNYAVWIPVAKLPIGHRVDYGFTEEAKKCRAILAGLARGNSPPPTDAQLATEYDPNYDAHCEDVAQLAAALTTYAEQG